MPRIKKKTPLSPPEELPISLDLAETTPLPALPSSPEEQSPKIKKTFAPRSPFLSVAEKRKWLASILRDTSGQHQGYELGLGDKFKALIEDNKLAGHPESEQEASAEKTDGNKDTDKGLQNLLQALLSTVKPPHYQRFKEKP